MEWITALGIIILIILGLWCLVLGVFCLLKIATQGWESFMDDMMIKKGRNK